MELDIDVEQKLSRDCNKKITEELSNSDTPVTCGGSGCFFCCSLNVDCFPEEVQKLAEIVISGEVDIDMGKLESRVKGSTAIKDNWCPFLRGGKCSVYDNRPVMCSRMMVVTDPKHCRISDRRKATQVEPSKLDKRWQVLVATYGKVRLHVALYNLLLKAGYKE